MPKVATADSLLDWELLLANAESSFDDPQIEELLAKLRTVLGRTRELQDLCQRLKAERQAATKEFRESKEVGKKLAIRIRHALGAAYGEGNAVLISFGIKPRLRRARAVLVRDVPLPRSKARKLPRT